MDPSRTVQEEGEAAQGVARSPAVLGRGVEVIFLLAVCIAIFFIGLGRFDFIKTEALRAVVVQEMLEAPGIAMPSVHHQPQLKKPPLYAWATSTLARGVGRFDEYVARLPSALAATLLVLLLYGVSERCIGRGAGLMAAALTLAVPTVLDYGVRAELDMGFTLLTTVSILLAYPGMANRGSLSTMCWMGCYLAATLASLWKGPHALIFLWVMLLSYGWRTKRWRWLWNPGQVVGLTLCLASLTTWALFLSGHAGAKSVGRTAGIELLTRLVPYKADHFLSILYAVPMMVVIVLPASLFVIASMRCGAMTEGDACATLQPGIGRGRYLLDRFRGWWQVLAQDRFAEYLLFWLVPNLIWSSIVPAKAPRYWLVMFIPMILLATLILWRYSAGKLTQAGRGFVDSAWRGVYGFVGLAGVLAFICGILAMVRPQLSIASASIGPAWVWLVLAGGCLAMTFAEFQHRWPRATIGRCVGLVVVVLAAKPVLLQTWWPARVASDTQRMNSAMIDAIVPEGQPVFVLSNKELPDLEFYSQRRYQWLPKTPADAIDYTTAASIFGLLREEDIDEAVVQQGFAYETLLTFKRADRQIALVRIDSVNSAL